MANQVGNLYTVWMTSAEWYSIRQYQQKIGKEANSVILHIVDKMCRNVFGVHLTSDVNGRQSRIICWWIWCGWNETLVPDYVVKVAIEV